MKKNPKVILHQTPSSGRDHAGLNVSPAPGPVLNAKTLAMESYYMCNPKVPLNRYRVPSRHNRHLPHLFIASSFICGMKVMGLNLEQGRK